ncbi:MAG: TonB-dependent receptor [Cycloclasticus sp.]|nr:TonB-dependent receptor [Cycloclasticus sp.]
MKQFKLSLLSAAIVAASANAADYSNQTIIVEGSKMRPGAFGIAPDSSALKDTASLLKRIPGANVNRNGPLTGIASYRGLFSSRVNVTVDGAAIKETCPNGMDPSLSHLSAVLTENLTVYRGIAPVSSGMETMGGTMEVEARRSHFTDGDEFEYHGAASIGFSEVDDGVVSGMSNEYSNNKHRFHLKGSYEDGNDYEFDGSQSVSPSEYNRETYSVGYGFKQAGHEFGFDYTNTDTGSSGTPALPMDIVYARGGIVTTDYSVDFGEGRKLETSFFYQDMRHLMDNYSSRDNGMMMDKYRDSLSTVDGGGFSAVYHLPMYNGSMSYGLDAEQYNHDAQITDPTPTNGMFYIDNFNGVERDRYSAFSEWKGDIAEGLELEMGVRYTQVEMDAGDVGSSMTGMVAGLAQAFNASDRSQTDHNWDFDAILRQTLSNELTAEIGFARKTRSASYQERYLWLPLESTAGLADGHVYVGDVDLDSETAYQFEAGLEYASNGYYVAPRAFYHRINDYIQGEEITGTPANMVANMMSGNPKVLQFANVDVELYGMDVEWGYEMSSNWNLDGTVSYVRGKRRDSGDNLYRIAPFNARTQLTYAQDSWSVATELEAYAAQNDVADYNDEQKSAGYGLLHLRGEIQPAPGFNVGLGIENILDKDYEDHVSGTNRAMGSDIAIGDKVPGQGRNLYLTASYEW